MNFEGIHHKTLLGGHDADLDVTGAQPAKGEAAEAFTVHRSCSNPLTCFAHVLRCSLPAMGELPFRLLRSTLEKMRAKFGRCKSRAKILAGPTTSSRRSKGGLLNVEIDFEFSCRTFSTCSKADEIRGSPHSSGRFCAKVRAACAFLACMRITRRPPHWQAGRPRALRRSADARLPSPPAMGGARRRPRRHPYLLFFDYFPPPPPRSSMGWVSARIKPPAMLTNP